MNVCTTTSASSSLTILNCDYTYCSSITTSPAQAIAVKQKPLNY